MSDGGWWQGGVLYQVYLPTFADGNGDGIGDFEGLTGRLDHLTELGVDGVWLSPAHPSGGVDGGYDVTDFFAIDPAYGGLEALAVFLGEAHRRELRVLMDFVPNHTSDRHPWFLEALADRASPRRSWYLFSDGKDGGPPNNWLSRFGGPAWERDEASGQWYLHSYYREQPDLNWHDPSLRQAMAQVLRFWVERGVDGFRVDAIHRIAKDPELRDNPLRPGADPADEWATLVHLYDHNHALVSDYLEGIRRAVGPERVLLGEVFLSEDTGGAGAYLGEDKLDLAFNFPFAACAWDPLQMAAVVAAAEARFPPGWPPAYHLSNHDMPRHASRYGEPTTRAAAVLLLTLRGTAVLYQGEEVGMIDGVVPDEARHDRLARDPARTPMQWEASPNAAFCPPGVRPWLPVAAGFETRNVAVQRGEPASLLSLYRRLVALRRGLPALRQGTYRQAEAPEGCWAYLREAGQERLLVAINFVSEAVELEVPPGRVVLSTEPEPEGERLRRFLRLGADEAVVVRLD